MRAKKDRKCDREAFKTPTVTPTAASAPVGFLRVGTCFTHAQKCGRRARLPQGFGGHARTRGLLCPGAEYRQKTAEPGDSVGREESGGQCKAWRVGVQGQGTTPRGATWAEEEERTVVHGAEPWGHS